MTNDESLLWMVNERSGRVLMIRRFANTTPGGERCECGCSLMAAAIVTRLLT